MSESALSTLAQLIEATYSLGNWAEAQNDAVLQRIYERIDSLVADLSVTVSDIHKTLEPRPEVYAVVDAAKVLANDPNYGPAEWRALCDAVNNLKE